MAIPREHRRCLLRISQELSSEDLHSLIYITDVPDNGIKDGIQLFDLLSRRRQLGQDYSFLIDCLRDIGRNDLAKKIIEEIPNAVVGAPPPCTSKPGHTCANYGNEVQCHTCEKEEIFFMHERPRSDNALWCCT